MAHKSELTLGQGVSGFGSPQLQSAITRGAGTAGESLLSPRVAGDTGLPGPSASFAAAGRQIAPKAEGTQAASSGQVGTPLGGLLNSLTEGLVTGPAKRFQRAFIDDAGIQARANQLAQQKFDTVPEGVESLDGNTIDQINAEALQQAQSEGQTQNQEAFSTVVGSQLISSGVNAGLQLSALNNAIDSQVKQMEKGTARFINGVEHNARMREQAREIVGMRANLRTMDSILTQAEPAVSGQQQQSFLRNPELGTRI